MSSAFRLLTAVVLCIAATPCAADDVAPQPAKPKAPLSKLELADGDGIVFLGDSITHQCLYTQYVEDYFYTRFPNLRLRFHNSGVGGDRCSDALLRFDRDVAAYKPKYVTVLLGMNDGGVQPYNHEFLQAYHRDMQALLDKITGIGATPILMTPTMYDSRAARIGKRPHSPEAMEFYNAVLAYYGAWLRETAVERGLGFVDMYGPLNQLTLEQRKTEPTFTLIPDAVHPAAAGQLVMAYAVLSDLAPSRRVSTITIDRDSEKARVKALGAKVTDAAFTADGLRFDVLAESLPLAFPAAAELGAKLTRIGHRLGREAIEIHGLAPGKYRLTIDDAVVGDFTHEQLETALELQENPKTPQHQQALSVAELNRKRNDEAIHPLRDLWREQKLLRLSRTRLGENPDSETYRKRVAELETKLADMDDRIAKLEAAAKKIEDEIYATNRIPVRHYRLERLK